MERVERPEAQLDQIPGSRLDLSVIQISCRQPVKPSLDSLGAADHRVLAVLEVVRGSPHESKPVGSAEKSQHRLCLDPDSRLRLVVEWSLETADIHVHLHTFSMASIAPVVMSNDRADPEGAPCMWASTSTHLPRATLDGPPVWEYHPVPGGVRRSRRGVARADRLRRLRGQRPSRRAHADLRVWSASILPHSYRPREPFTLGAPAPCRH